MRRSLNVNPGVNDNEVKATVNITSGTATGTLAIESGRAEIIWDNDPSAQALANTSTTQGGVVELPSGTVLPNRIVGVDLIRSPVPTTRSWLRRLSSPRARSVVAT